MVRMLRAVPAVVAIFALIGCDSHKYSNTPPNELHTMAKSLPIDKRYDLYIDVYKDRTPSNPILAEDVAQLGEPARLYSIARAQHGDIVEFQAALTVLSRFETKCSAEQKSALLIAASRLSCERELQDHLINFVNVACDKTPPPGWR